MDIPRWLYEKTRDGEFYDIEYGAGYAPDYENEYFMERHSLALQALADYCNKDDFCSICGTGKPWTLGRMAYKYRGRTGCYA